MELWEAASEGRTDDVIEMLRDDPSIDVNYEDFEANRSPLYRAASFGHWKIVQALLKDSRIKVNHQQSQQATPLYAACFHGHAHVAQLLLSHPEILPNLAREDGSTPLFAACQQGHTRLVEILCSHPRVDVNLTRSDGISPIWVAAQNGFHECVMWILARKRDADVSLQPIGDFPWAGKTAEQQAHAAGHPLMASLLASFAFDPELTRDLIRRELGLLEYDAALTFSFIILKCDQYLRFSSDLPQDSKIRRFFSIASRLNLDLQEFLCTRVFQLKRSFLPKYAKDESFSKVFRAFE